MNKFSCFVGVVLVATTLNGCGGGGGGGDSTLPAATYSIGGSVSGLAGSGLVLANNNADELVISADGNFQISTEVADTSAYAVTVVTQPTSPTQTCTVNNGNGTVDGADVIDVAVVCATNTYTVSGSVSGLAGSGLVLANNNADELAVAADGSFQFSTALADTTAYAVTVATQPTSPSQACTVTNGSGTIAGADVVDVAVVCATNTYTLSGSVSGLAGSGLILTNNNADELVVSADGSFQFAAAVADASAYNVAVAARPKDPNQTCLVSNGGGTVAGAEVTNVSVDCVTDPAFSVGGTVTGYLGGGILALGMNGQTITVAADGAFSFPTPVFQGVAYDVSVVAHPAGPNQLCEVTNGSGMMAGTVNDVTVSCETVNYTPAVAVPALWGEGMVVTNTSTGEAINITSRLSNAFASQADGSSYSLAVTTQPSSPNQICNVTDGVGNISGSNVTLTADCVLEKYNVPLTVTGTTGSYEVSICEQSIGSQLCVGTRLGTWLGDVSTTWSFSDGSEYQVAMRSDPAGQKCTVNNAVGTINGADVLPANGVSIICSDITHNVGGAISGLTAEGLVLENNGETLAVSSSSSSYSFTMADAASYDISVNTQPAGLRCDVTNGSGSNVTTDITTASISCAANAQPMPYAGTYNMVIFSPNDSYLDATGSTGLDAGDTHTYTWSEVSGYGVTFINNGSTNPDDTQIHYDFPDGVAVIKAQVTVTIDDGVYTPVTSAYADYYIYREDYAYVTTTGGGNGSAPDNPLGNINDAIAYAEANGRTGVAVQEGEYLVKSELGTQVVMHEGVSLYGGHDKPTWLRDVANYTTTIYEDNSRGGVSPVRAVEIGSSVTRNTVLDGFTIRGGSYNTSSAVYIYGGSPIIRNNIISGPGAGTRGVGVYIDGGNPYILNNVIYDTGDPYKTVNNPFPLSIGLYAIHDATPLIVKNTISGGMSYTNYGIYLSGATAVIANNTITGGQNAVNVVDTHGDAMSYGLYLAQAGDTKLYNNTINGGGSPVAVGVAISASSPKIINNIIFTEGNTAETWPTGVCISEVNSDSTPVQVSNNMLTCGYPYRDAQLGCYTNDDNDGNSKTCSIAEVNALLDMDASANIGGRSYVYGLVDANGPSDDFHNFEDNDWHLNGDYTSQTTGGLCLWPVILTDRDGVERTPSGYTDCAGQTGWSLGAYEHD